MAGYYGGFGSPAPDGSTPDPPTSPAPGNANLGGFNGGSGNTPNSRFNPTGNTDSHGTHNFTSGGDSNQDTTLANVSPNTGAAPPPNKLDYRGWKWEQILNLMLGLKLPDRSLITNGRWTGIETGTDLDPGLFRIFSLNWTGGGGHKQQVNVYLSPEFTMQSAKDESPWLVYEQGPGLVLGDSAAGTFGLQPGAFGLTDAGSQLALDPAGFAPAVQALMDAENFYANAADSFGYVSKGLAGDASQFQGEAGQAFAQLMQNFSQQATYAHSQMGAATDKDHSYSGTLQYGAETADAFLYGLWNAWAGWTNMLTHTPLGAILQALIDQGVVTGAAGSWSVAPNVNLENVPNVGDLRTDPAWQTIEGIAKREWEQNSLVNALDFPSAMLLSELALGYDAVADLLAPLKPHAPTPVGVNANGSAGGPNMPNFDFPNLAMPNFTMPNFTMPNLDLPNIQGGGNGNLGDLGGGNGNGGLGLGGDAGGTGGLAPEVSFPHPVQQALASNAGTQDALQSALTSGQVPPGSALQGTLNTGLAGANQAQAALNQAAGATGTTSSALHSALADNAGTQAALSQALASGQVPPGSALAGTLQTALNDANGTQAALNQAIAAGPSAAQTSAMKAALGDNSQTQHELNQALMSGQVPANSPLHSTIQSALSDAGKTQAAIDQALKSGTGTTTASLDQALKDNQATQHELNAALASGQVPATGPLRDDLNRALADSKQTGVALQQALAQQGVRTEPNLAALTSAVGVPGLASAGAGLGGTPLLTASLPGGGTALATPVSSGAFVPATQAAPAAGGMPFPEYTPMAGGGMMGGQGQGQGQGQERERSTWLAEDEDIWGTDPDVGPRVLGRDDIGDEEPEEYDGYTERDERPARRRPRRVPGRQR
jgi:hypothetical protein